MHLVSQLGRVNAITCEFSMDIVGRFTGEVYTGNQFPKRDKLLNVINVKTLLNVELVDPKVVFKRLLNRAILYFCFLKELGCVVLCPSSI
jgi:hypothetical protein